MLRSSMGGKEIYQLQLGRHMMRNSNLILHNSAHKRSIITNMLGELMLDRVMPNTDSTSIVGQS